MTILLSLFLACGGKQVISTAPAPAAAPQSNISIPPWVMTSPFPDKICAAGSYKFKGNIQMAMTGSADAGRNELARQLEIHVTNMFKSFAEEGTADGEDFSESLSTSVSKSIADQTLSGTVPVRQEEIGGIMWSLVCLDDEKFISAFDRMEGVSDKARSALKSRARESQDELRAEVDALRKMKAEQ